MKAVLFFDLMNRYLNVCASQDLRNHGDSPHSPEHDYMALASDVKSFVRQHMLSRPTIIGHSMYALNNAKFQCRRLLITLGALK